MRRLFGIAIAVAALLSISIVGVSAGVSGPSFYVDGDLYRTVGTPTDFSNTGAPDHSFDVIYEFFGVQEHNVATAAPGDPGFNGGRWKVHGLEFATEDENGNPYDGYAAAVAAYDTNGSNDLDSDEEIHAALDGGVGGATDIGIVKSFECPVIPVPGGPDH